MPTIAPMFAEMQKNQSVGNSRGSVNYSFCGLFAYIFAFSSCSGNLSNDKTQWHLWDFCHTECSYPQLYYWTTGDLFT